MPRRNVNLEDGQMDRRTSLKIITLSVLAAASSMASTCIPGTIMPGMRGTEEVVRQTTTPQAPREEEHVFVASSSYGGQSCFVSSNQPDEVSRIHHPGHLITSSGKYGLRTSLIEFNLRRDREGVSPDFRNLSIYRAKLILTLDGGPEFQIGDKSHHLLIGGVGSPWDQETLTWNRMWHGDPFERNSTTKYVSFSNRESGNQITIDLMGLTHLETGKRLVEHWAKTSHGAHGLTLDPTYRSSEGEEGSARIYHIDKQFLILGLRNYENI